MQSTTNEICNLRNEVSCSVDDGLEYMLEVVSHKKVVLFRTQIRDLQDTVSYVEINKSLHDSSHSLFHGYGRGGRDVPVCLSSFV